MKIIWSPVMIGRLKNILKNISNGNFSFAKKNSKDRKGWESIYHIMANNKDDILLDKNSLSKQTKWDNEEWEW